ncbi:MAG: FAD-linked oxidase C-terminal domain-containing protein [Verrucomicrobiota bacterium]
MNIPPRKVNHYRKPRMLKSERAEGFWEDLEVEDKSANVVARKDPKTCADLRKALIELIGANKVSITKADRSAHSTDKWFASAEPDVVVFPHSTEDVSKVLAYANQHRIPVTTRGAGVGYVGGCVPVSGGIVLTTERMNRIIGIHPKDGVVIVEPGVITGDLQQAVRAVGWDYPPDPASLKECSIGGNIATNAGGPRCLKYGVTRNYVLGLEVVLADGRIMRSGGRLHKNKTGFDLIGLFVGSEGMLGVVTEITLGIIPKPASRGMLAAVFSDFETAAKTVQAILQAGHLPSALEISDEFTLAAARKKMGAHVFPEGNGHLIVEIDGRPTAVQSELIELQALLRKCGAGQMRVARDETECEAIWQLRREFSYALRDTKLTKLNEDIVVPRGKLVDLVNFARKLEAETGISFACFGHAGDGNIHTNLMIEDYMKPTVKKRADRALDALFDWVLDQGGAITGEHGVGLAKKPWIRKALGETSFDVHRTIKNAMDPNGILNPGKFLD